MKTRFVLVVAVLVLAAQLEAQRMDLGNQGKNVDFTTATATKPFKSGTTLPATCKVGEAFFKTDGVPGFNYFGCTAENVWTLQNGAGVSSVSDLGTTQVSPTQLTVAPGRWSTGATTHTSSGATISILTMPVTGATNTSPIVIQVASAAMLRTGDTVSISGVTGNTAANGTFPIILTGPTTFQLQGSAGNGNYAGGGTIGGTGNGLVYLYGSDGGFVAVEHAASAGMLLGCVGNCVVNQVAAPSMASNSVPLSVVTVTGGAFVTVADQRSFLTNRGVAAGQGIAVNDMGGAARISVDATVARLPGGNTWTGSNSFSASTRTAPFRAGTGNPMGQSCADGDTYWQTDAPSSDKLWTCTGPNTWRVYGAASASSMPVLEEEFLSATEAANDFGQYRWRGLGDRTPAAELVGGGLGFHHPGTYAISTNPTANSTTAMTLKAQNGTNQLVDLGTTTGWLMEAILVTEPTATPAEMNLRFGLSDDAVSQSAANAVELRWRNNTGCTVTGTDASLTYHNRSAGTSTTAVSGVATASTQSIHVRVRSVVAGTALFSLSINGGAFGSEVTVAGVPTAPVSPFFAITTCGATSRKAYVDYFRFVPGTLQR